MIELIGDLPVRCARVHAAKDANVFKGARRSFSEFNQRVNRCAHALRRLGLERGDHVAVLARNRPEALEICFAAAKLGAVHLPVNFRLAASEAAFVLNDAGARALFVASDFDQLVAEAGSELAARHVLSIDRDYEALLADEPDREPEATVAPDDPFAVFYTSGSTGLPKGVVLTHRNFLAGAVNHIIAYGLQPTDVCIHVMPLYHAMEASLAICQFYVGGTNVFVESFDAAEFWRLVAEEGITHITLVHTMLSDMLDEFERGGHALGSLRSICAGGQAVPTEVIRRTVRVLGPGVLFVVYGMTEASPLLTYLPKEDIVTDGPESRRLASVGKEMFSCRVRVVDDSGHDTAPGGMGEIVARGPNVMAGYHNRPDETAGTLRDGWLRTGDMGMVDEDGYIYIVDRKKDLIISGGENIAPGEVEDVLYTHPAVAECCVVGIPDERWGEAVLAVVASHPQSDVSERELIDYCRGRLARYKCPRQVAFRQSLPRDPVGKLQRRLLQEEYAGAALPRSS